MGKPFVFVSYKHDEISAPVGAKLFKKLKIFAPGLGIEFFKDYESMQASDAWRDQVNEALAKTTHFIALISTDYWDSTECKRELFDAIGRWEASGKKSPKLLFVMAEKVDASLLVLDEERKSGRLKSDNPILQKVGDVHFLGPFDEKTFRLGSIDQKDPARMNEQLEQLIRRLKQVL